MNGEPFGLPTDRAGSDLTPVAYYLEKWAVDDTERMAVSALINAVLEAASRLSKRIARGAIPGDLSAQLGVNTDGDNQKALDLASHDLFVQLLSDAGATSILSEEAELPVKNSRGNGFAVAIDPLDGSGNVGLGAPLGTFFSIIPETPGTDPFAKLGKEIVAAGYVSYGNSLDLGFSVGEGLVLATFDPFVGSFLVLNEHVGIKADTSDLAFNASVRNHTDQGIAAYLADTLSGQPHGKSYNMRWLGAAVGELHRIIHRGGVFLYVGDERPGYENGRLRHLYEANPIAFLMQQAGGAATDGSVAILEKPIASHHARTPLVFGSVNEVNTISNYVAGTPAYCRSGLKWPK